LRPAKATRSAGPGAGTAASPATWPDPPASGPDRRQPLCPCRRGTSPVDPPFGFCP
jgi:hypothetical protein